MRGKEATKIVELGGRRWQIGRFDALTGSYVLTVLLRYLAPAFAALMPNGFDTKLDSIKENFNPALLMGIIPKIDRKELAELQVESLRVCAQLQIVGDSETALPVLMADGRFSVPDLESDVMTVLMLTVHCLIFNVSSFFDASALSGIAASFTGLSLFNAPT